MNKKFKLASAFLATNLLVIPISGIISQNDNVAKAKVKNQSINSNIIKIDYLSYEETIEIIEELYKQNVIDKNKYNELMIMTKNKSFWGSPYVVYFNDGAKDVHIPGWMITAGGVLSASALTAAITAAAAKSSIIGTIVNSNSSKGIRHVADIIVGGATFSALRNGVVLYYKPYTRYECDESGKYCSNVIAYDFQHFRIDY